MTNFISKAFCCGGCGVQKVALGMQIQRNAVINSLGNLQVCLICICFRGYKQSNSGISIVARPVMHFIAHQLNIGMNNGNETVENGFHKRVSKTHDSWGSKKHKIGLNYRPGHNF